MRVAFPRISHVVNGPLSGGGVTRDDLIISKDEEVVFFQPPPLPPAPMAPQSYWLVVEEKIDGANLGISLNSEGALQCQNRSHLVHSKSHTQFSTLDSFLDENSSVLCDFFHTLAAERGGAPQDYILFGEWCALLHSVYYDSLPEPFVVFDLAKIITIPPAAASKKTKAPPSAAAAGSPGSRGPTPPPANNEALQFFTTEVRNYYVDRCCPNLPIVPLVCEQQVPVDASSKLKNWDELHALWGGSDSTFSNSGSKMEGVVMRQECRTTVGAPGSTMMPSGLLSRRCKAVRDDFKDGIEEGGHWMSKELKKNIILHYDPRKV